MFPHQNPLPKPEIITTPAFETLLSSVKADVLDYLQQNSPEDVAAVTETFNNEAELLTKFTEAFAVILQNHFRQMNAQALQMFGMYATDSEMVDVIASQLGVVRQEIDPGDPDAFPPVPATMESNDSLLTRYYLAAFALATTGTRGGYRYHAMTLGGRPQLTVTSPDANQVLVAYSFSEHEMAGLTKDAQARQVSPGAVDCFILGHDGNGLPSQELLDATQDYLERDDIGQETDLITVRAPTIQSWNCEAQLFIRPGPDADVIKATAVAAVQEYAAEQHRLGGSIEPSMMFSVLLKATGAHRGEITQPAQPIRCTYSEAPYLESIEITIVTEST
jgi:phage-related baseplate assembly protein